MNGDVINCHFLNPASDFVCVMITESEMLGIHTPSEQFLVFKIEQSGQGKRKPRIYFKGNVIWKNNGEKVYAKSEDD